ncbi:Hypothetical predicted protein [Marmota monax]|uniref:Cathelicidin antimicrobial peptide C-terminal domain-containing protein n=2 Tax=Marmota monax TaxID=9995 RepID=A0A5E4ACJ9_MARMO|nr:Hypothetical predicted protein [Marmota monax]
MTADSGAELQPRSWWPAQDGAGSGGLVVGSLHQAQAEHKGGSCGLEEAVLETMQTQREGGSFLEWQSLLLLLLGLMMPLAIAQTLSYQEAVLRAVDGFNQQSSDANLYRLLSLDSQSQGDEDPDTPKPVSFTVKETVCPKTTQQTLEQCDFKEDGLVKRCVGTVTLDLARDSFDINCDGPQHFKKIARLGGLLQKGGEKIGEKLENIGRKIKDFFQSLVPRSRS